MDLPLLHWQTGVLHLLKIKAASNIAQQTDSIPITVATTVGDTAASAGTGYNQSSHQGFIKKNQKAKNQQRSLISADWCGSLF